MTTAIRQTDDQVKEAMSGEKIATMPEVQKPIHTHLAQTGRGLQ